MKTTIDWLTFRTRSNPWEVLEALRPIFGTVGEMLDIRTGIKGKDGWVQAAEITIPDHTLGRIDYAGASQNGWVRVNIYGEGCGWVQDWASAECLVDTLQEAEIKRLDIALTTYQGEVSDAMVEAAYLAGMFTCGGRPPKMKSILGSDPTDGRTRYIGKRENHKFLRCYEKGWEMLSKLPDEFGPIRKAEINGLVMDGVGAVDPAKVYRVELELKDVDKFIPWTAIGRRDDVFAGSYPFCAGLLPGVPHWTMTELPSFKPKADLAKAISNVFRSYGKTIKAAHLAYGGDQAALLQVFNAICAAEPSPRLVDSGVLTVDHEPLY